MNNTGKSGAYLINCNAKPEVEHATSPELAEKLWELSEDLIGEKFMIWYSLSALWRGAVSFKELLVLSRFTQYICHSFSLKHYVFIY